ARTRPCTNARRPAATASCAGARPCATPTGRRSSGRAWNGAPMLRECPETELDPWSDALLTNPFPAYEELRTQAPVVKLRKYGCWAALGYDALAEVLSDYGTFSSAAGVGLDNYHRDKPWRPKSIILETDPPEHNKARRVLNRVLSRPAMER